MIECIFTLDYELYGNGTGSLKELVYEPADQLRRIFLSWNARFVAFVEVAELEKIEAWGTDRAIDLVQLQIRDLHRDEFEIGLHLHPQWCNSRYEQGQWMLDLSEYNLCLLSPSRIAEIVNRSVAYLRYLVGSETFTPLSFRAGNWLFQPTAAAARILSQNKIRIDSSVYKGGLQHYHSLDFRAALHNGYFWTFSDEVTCPDPEGALLEVPIYTVMAPFWRLATSKRLGVIGGRAAANKSIQYKLNRAWDMMRFRYPLKLDFCRMSLTELTSLVDKVILEDVSNPAVYRPLVAIGHTKDQCDLNTVESFLAYL